jgi:diguanylate cyclase (GGDEF)-like protein
MPSNGKTKSTEIFERPNRLSAEKKREPYLICLSGKDMGRTFPLKPDSTLLIGRSEECDIAIENGTISRRHVSVTVTSAGKVFIEDLDSTNGTFVNGTMITKLGLRQGDQILLGPEIIFRFDYHDSADLAMASKLYEAANRDPLTGIYNKRYLIEKAESAFTVALEGNRKLSMLMMDLDDFKAINDAHGHPAGDHILRCAANLAQSITRSGCTFARYGGEEFSMLLPEVGLPEAYALADRVRRRIAQKPFLHKNQPIKVTMSIGIAAFVPKRHKSLSDLVCEADENLYAAKRAGKNRVEPVVKPKSEKSTPKSGAGSK